MSFTYVTVTHEFREADEAPATGKVAFTPVAPMHNAGTVTAAAVTATLVNGALSVRLAANTDPDTLPTGTTYKVVETITGQVTNTYFVQIPHDEGGTVNLAVLSGWAGATFPAAVVETVNGV